MQSVPSRSAAKENPSGRPERAESQRIGGGEEGKGKERRDKEKEQPGQVLGKKGINNQIRHFLLLRIQFSAKAALLWCLFHS